MFCFLFYQKEKINKKKKIKAHLILIKSNQIKLLGSLLLRFKEACKSGKLVLIKNIENYLCLIIREDGHFLSSFVKIKKENVF